MEKTLSYTATAKLIRGLGFRVSRTDGEIRVGFPGNESAAYYTDCPADALATAQDMRKRADAGAVPVADPEGEAVESGDHVAGEPWDGPATFEAVRVYNVTYATGRGDRTRTLAIEAQTEAEARESCVAQTYCDFSGPAGIQSVALAGEASQ